MKKYYGIQVPQNFHARMESLLSTLRDDEEEEDPKPTPLPSQV